MSDLDQLLAQTSRTFGVAIPLLPEPTRVEVTIAYLLFRVADTLEDAVSWSTSERIAALHDLESLLRDPSTCNARILAARWTANPPCTHEGYLDLLKETPFVFNQLLALSDQPRHLITCHSLRTLRGMASYVTRISGSVDSQFQHIEELRDYCYVVAGIVGEMLTELFVLRCGSLEKFKDGMLKRSNLFGEGLQLVNILKDAEADALEGRSLLPIKSDWNTLFALAREDLTAGADYILTLQKADAPKGFMTFSVLPLFLAWATLDVLAEKSNGNKVSRSVVEQLLRCIDSSFNDGGPPFSHESLRGLYESVVGVKMSKQICN